MGILDKILRAGEGKTLRTLEGISRQVNAIEDDFVAMTDEELRALTGEYRTRLEQGETLDDLLPEAFATVREAARRTLGQRHYDVQIMGGAALHLGNIAEMRTGEGKTLVATLPSYLNALSGKGVHVVTVNDYLAERDSEWMGRIHRFLGLDVGVILAHMSPAERRDAYAADITYGTNNEFGFDYLRDNMAWSAAEMVQRGHNFAVVDEVDSILVDEARTPLIISGPADQPTKWYAEFARIARLLVLDEDYEVDEKKKTIGVLEAAIDKVEDQLGIDNLYDTVNTPLVGFLNNAIRAKELFKRDRDYVILEGEILIVDEHTGRLLKGRRYNEGLHQAIEAKEGVEIKAENQTLATVTLQNYFRLYDKLSGMTGTAMTEAAEFHQIYALGVVPIPTNRPMVRLDEPDLVYRTVDAKYAAVIDDIEERNAAGQPVLVGTTSVAKSELIASELKKRGVRHEVLNAKNHEREATIIAEAGHRGAVTVATNMAGRGTDIILGGNSDYMARLKLREVLLPKLVRPENEHRPIPSAKAAREARSLGSLYPCSLSQATEQALAELSKELVAAWGDRQLTVLELEDRIAQAAEKAPSDDGQIQALRELIAEVKGEYDSVVKQDEQQVREAGGLHVIGTERHESRRVDNQLRGRAGRQGDPGSTRFFLSLEDNLLRIFGGDRVAGLMNAFRVEEDMPIESGMLTRSLEGAQKKVETYYYDIRKQVFEYDEVMNNQRKAVYTERRRVLEGRELKAQVIGYGERTVEDIVEAYVNPELPPEEWDLSRLVEKTKEFIYLLEDLTPEQLQGLGVEELKAFLQEQLRNAYDIKEGQVEQQRPGLMREAERYFILQQIDTLWREHLQAMDALRESVGLRGYGQKDPLIEYKNEGYDMFLEMMTQMRRNVIYSMFMFQPAPAAAPVA